MIKRTLPVLLCFMLVFPHGARPVEQTSSRRGLFVSMIQDPPVLTSRRRIRHLVDFSKKANVDVLFVQIYRANKTWFPSKVGDPSWYDESVKKVKEDPFALLIREAHASGIQVHAWLNLLSLSINEKAPILEKYGPDILTRNVKPKSSLQDYRIDNQYFLDPGDPRVHEELSTMVEEIVRRYPELDGIQFDYIRYPDSEPRSGHNSANEARFKEASGSDSIDDESEVWHQWKREQVTSLLKELIAKARALHPEIHVSTTGCMVYRRAYFEAFQDWPSWVSSGLTEFVTIMTYPPDVHTFRMELADAREHVNFDKVNIALPAYKLVKKPEVFAAQFRLCEQAGARMCVPFHYGDLVTNPALKTPLTGEHEWKITTFFKHLVHWD